MSARVVALLPVRNGEADLPDWFRSIESIADAVVALDDGSTDRTAAMLQAHPLVEVMLQNPRRESYAGWDDADNRNRLLHAAGDLRPDWILSLDVDERISAEDGAALRAFIERDALKSVVYAFRVYRMISADEYDRSNLVVRRLFAWEPGQTISEQRLHPVPIPVSLLDRPWLLTTVRIQHLAGMTDVDRRARYAKYVEVDPRREYQASYESLLDPPLTTHKFESRAAGLAVLDGPNSPADGIELDDPVLSAIVIARNSDTALADRVQAVVAQECPVPFEVIVVASGSGDAADRVRARFPEVSVISLSAPALPGAARNAGLSVARGDIVSFPGSHVSLAAGSLAARVQAHERGYAMVTGTTRNGTTTRAGWAGYFLDNSTALPGRPSGELSGPPAHCSYLRHVLVEVGGFPEHLRAGEDTVVNHELVRRGYTAYREAAAVLVHHNPCPTPAALVAHHFVRGRAFGRILVERNAGGGLLREEAPTLRGYRRRRVRTIDGQVAKWGDPELGAEYRRARPLVQAAAVANWSGAWLELLKPGPGKRGLLWGPRAAGPLVFVHVPRTGGNSVVHAIEHQYGTEHVLHFYDNADAAAGLSRLSAAELAEARAVVGHFAYGVHEYLRDASYVTFVRDPVERVISHYAFVRTHRQLAFHERALEGVGSLDDYVTKSRYASLVNNGMTRLLGGDIQEPGAPATSETLEAAKQNLGTFAVVGVQERFDESLQRVANRFGWSDVRTVRVNAVPDRPARADLPASTIALIESHNQLDRELYEHVVAGF